MFTRYLIDLASVIALGGALAVLIVAAAMVAVWTVQ